MKNRVQPPKLTPNIGTSGLGNFLVIPLQTFRGRRGTRKIRSRGSLRDNWSRGGCGCVDVDADRLLFHESPFPTPPALRSLNNLLSTRSKMLAGIFRTPQLHGTRTQRDTRARSKSGRRTFSASADGHLQEGGEKSLPIPRRGIATVLLWRSSPALRGRQAGPDSPASGSGRPSLIIIIRSLRQLDPGEEHVHPSHTYIHRISNPL